MQQSRQPGFTLVEILLYVGLVGTLVTIISSFAFVLLQVRTKAEAAAEVEQQGAAAVLRISQAARNAEAVTSPTVGTSGAALVLDVVPAASDPTTLDLASGALRLAYGVGAPVALTSSSVSASNLTVTNLSRPGTAGSVRIQFTLSYLNPTGRSEFDYSRTFYAAATLRPQ